MQEECLAVLEDDFITHHAIQRGADFIFRSAQIDIRRCMTAERTEFVAKTHIYRGAIDSLDRRAWSDRQATFIQPGFNISVT